jgi:hypothetical protein
MCSPGTEISEVWRPKGKGYALGSKRAIVCFWEENGPPTGSVRPFKNARGDVCLDTP